MDADQKETFLISCSCDVCRGRSARVLAGGRLEELVSGRNERARIATHNVVALAHSALSKARSVQLTGPWPVDAGED
jgi:hypothetical protein